jgi:hypothetical protein
MKSVLARAWLVALLVLAFPITARSQTQTQAPAVPRSLDEFLAAQGTFCFPDGMGGCFRYAAPLPNMLAWRDEANNRCAVADYAGLASKYLLEASGGAIDLGTEIAGTVEERALDDGRAEITVRLRVSNALVYSVAGCDMSAGPAEFGYLVPEILGGATPAVGDAQLLARFIDLAPGRPLPDLTKIASFPEFGQEFDVVVFDAAAQGALREIHGVPEGTEGKASIKFSLRFVDGVPHTSTRISLKPKA